MTGTGAGGAQLGWEDRALERSLASARDRSSERARRLVASARHLAATGSSSFTVADVATDAGISLRSFYRHFAGRDDLLLALFEEEARTAVVLLGELIAPRGRADRSRPAVRRGPLRLRRDGRDLRGAAGARAPPAQR